MPSHFMSILVLNKSHKYTKEPYREEGMNDHTLTGLAGPLHSGCYSTLKSTHPALQVLTCSLVAITKSVPVHKFSLAFKIYSPSTVSFIVSH